MCTPCQALLLQLHARRLVPAWRLCAPWGPVGGAFFRGPMQFKFEDKDRHPSGWMAFTGPATSRLLLLTDAGHDAVHVIDVVEC